MDESKKILNTEDWKVHLAFVHSEVMISGWLYWLTGNVDTPQMDHGASREQITIGKQTQLNDFMAEDSDVEVDNLAKTWDFCLGIAGLSNKTRNLSKNNQKTGRHLERFAGGFPARWLEDATGEFNVRDGWRPPWRCARLLEKTFWCGSGFLDLKISSGCERAAWCEITKQTSSNSEIADIRSWFVQQVWKASN